MPIYDCSGFYIDAGCLREEIENYGKPSPFADIGELASVWLKDALREKYTPTRILRSGRATIVFWQDGTKTVVKKSPDEEDNAYAAFTAALAIKIFGSNSKLKKIVERKKEEQK